MKTIETWKYANILGANLLMYASLLTILTQAILYYTVTSSVATTYSAIALVLFLLISIPVVEVQLKRKFDNKGVPKSQS